MIRIFIGFDQRETVAWHVLTHSILARSTEPVSFVPLALPNLQRIFHRKRDPLQSTDFAFSRFLTPYLSNYEGWSLFMDCDMLVRDDIAKLWALRDDKYSVMCVKHDHQPREATKFLNTKQTAYPKKNWSSVMLFNNAKCRALTSEFVNSSTGLQLHQFKWLEDDALIGALPQEWNHLVGYHAPNACASNVHFTSGGPYFQDYTDCEFADEWRSEKLAMERVDQRPIA